MCDEIIEVTRIVTIKTISAIAFSTKTIPTNFNEKRVTCKIENFYILLTFLLITISLMIIVSITVAS